VYRAYIRQSNVIANRQTRKKIAHPHVKTRKRKRTKSQIVKKKWMEFHSAIWFSKNFCKVTHFLLEISVHSKKERHEKISDISKFDLNFRKFSHNISTIAKITISFSSRCVSVYLFSFSKKQFFYILFNTSICTKRPQKASEKRPEMEWKKFGEWRNANGMFLSFLPSNFSLVTLIV